MKTLYIECNMGAAGDMLLSALLELVPDPDGFIERLNGLGLPGVTFKKSQKVHCGITGTHVSVTVNGQEEASADVPHGHDHPHEHDQGSHSHGHAHAREHTHGHDHNHPHAHSHSHAHAGHCHHSVADIARIIDGLPVPDAVRADARAVYGLIAEAEAQAHGRPVGEVHFHEVGALDAVADVVGVSLLMDALAPDRVVVSPIHVGSGQVKCAHGILPVPAPATAHILRGMPTYGGWVRGELCTPTGAALLRHFATDTGPMPVMTVRAVGYGMGTKEFGAANCVRVFLGEDGHEHGPNGTVSELSCNIDDMTGEALGYVSELLFAEGALDVFTIPIQMKKSRPGILLTCLCADGDADRFARLLLTHTTTFGVRRTEYGHRRYTLHRRFEKAETPYGIITVKTGEGYGVKKTKPEFGDVARAAREHGVPVSAVYDALKDQKERKQT
jgi:uncharacterized protein (TIGR00299 family) protein